MFVHMLVLGMVLMAAGAALAQAPVPKPVKPIKMVVLGDSLSAGLGLSASAAFPARLQKSLQSKGIAVDMINAGVSGDTSSGGRDRLDWSVPEGTEAVILELGAKPFVVAAMGSHGGATPDGQRSLLAHYQIDEAHLGVPVKTDMDAVQVGTNSWGEPVWHDKNALGADKLKSQALLVPVTLDVTEREADLAEEAVAELHALGFDLLRRGPRQISVLALPEPRATCTTP